MSLSLEQIRRTADRVAASHGLDVVEIEYLGGGKQRVLRVFIEQNPNNARGGLPRPPRRANSKACTSAKALRSTSWLG